MSENIPTPEPSKESQLPIVELSEEEKEKVLILHLKKQLKNYKINGCLDGETRALLDAWTDNQERKANELDKSGGCKGRINLNLTRARLYLEAGYTESALENFQAALECTNNMTDYYEKLYKESEAETRQVEIANLISYYQKLADEIQVEIDQVETSVEK